MGSVEKSKAMLNEVVEETSTIRDVVVDGNDTVTWTISPSPEEANSSNANFVKYYALLTSVAVLSCSCLLSAILTLAFAYYKKKTGNGNDPEVPSSPLTG